MEMSTATPCAARRPRPDVAPRPRWPSASRPCWQPTSTPSGRPPWRCVRAAVAYPTAVLRAAGVSPVARDAFDEARFPDDDYGLAPASLGALDPALTDPARAWGAAKAMAHKARHKG